jgi:hypothetical protein
VNPPAPVALAPSKSTADKGERPARSTGAMVPCSFRVPTVMKAAALDLCDRKPHQFGCPNDVYVTALRDFLEVQATASGDDQLLAALAPCRLVGDFERMQQTVLEGVQRTQEVVQAAVTRGMGERAHEVYGAQVEHFRTCGDNEWAKEGIRLLEAQVKPLLPRRSALSLRIVPKADDKPR